MEFKNLPLKRLKALASEYKIQGRSKMNKSALLVALRRSMKKPPTDVQAETLTDVKEIEAARVTTEYARERSTSATRYFESLENKMTRAAGFSGLLLTVLASLGGASIQAPKGCIEWTMFRGITGIFIGLFVALWFLLRSISLKRVNETTSVKEFLEKVVQPEFNKRNPQITMILLKEITQQHQKVEASVMEAAKEKASALKKGLISLQVSLCLGIVTFLAKLIEFFIP